ncbi:mercuric reductase [Stenotrophomonas chelatiphaga]|uniref:Mercuric reductase n=1 Tax=Stenotrophomonas chelatiphaga TaxID=517011 RepID=A0A0R0D4Q0_9GAMM|nr:mercuric reductase [Stenotrophomonas chelatiphaga]
MHDAQPSVHQFDAIIIGAGQAGPSLAGRLNAAGKRVAIIERHLVGGTCVNTGCKPTKTLVASAYAVHTARRGGEYGFSTGEVDVDMPAVAARARQVIDDSRGSNEAWLDGMLNVELIRGHARFIGSKLVEVNGQHLTAPNIFINVGGRPGIPDLPGLMNVPFMTNAGMVALDVLPRHLIVIGGSYIGLEFAQMYRRFGAEVTLIERSDRLIPREDPDISAAVRRILEGEHIKVLTSASRIEFRSDGQDTTILLETEAGPTAIVGSHVLVATGRVPNTDALGLDAAGIACDEHGYIRVDERLQTTVDGVYALGDCNGQGTFTHTAYNDFEIVAANLLDGDDRHVSSRVSSYALFIDPPLARVGLTQAQAVATGRPLLYSKREMTRVGRAVEKGETKGFMTVIADAETRQVLGAAILGTGGDEAIHGLLNMMNAERTIDEIRWAVPIHPTVAEFFPTMMLDLKAQAQA